jgi:protein-S-isoprenylcysteine O-methyltransferase Ste14
MSADAAHTRWWQVFEVVFGLPFLAAIGVQLAVPVSLPRGNLTALFIIVGALLAIAGVILVVLARQAFANHGQPTDPGRPTVEMITTGIFAISRNPLYLGGVLFLAGISLLFNFVWGLISLLPSFVAGHFLLIAPEEKYLSARFGERYRAYASKVNRWWGRKR